MTLDDSGQVLLEQSRVLSEAPPVPIRSLTSGASLPFSDIPNGELRIIVVRVRENQSEASELLRYGISEPFSLRADEVTIVDVPLSVVRPPDASSETMTPVEVLTVTSSVGAEVFVNNPTINLQLASDTGVRAEVSNFETFPSQDTECYGLGEAIEGCTQLDILNPGCVRESGSPMPCRYQLPWNTNLGFEDDCGAAEGSPFDKQDRCPRRVFIRFFDANGFASVVASQDIILDTRPPTISFEGTSVNPAAAISTDGVQINLAFSEPVLQGQGFFELEVEGSQTAPVQISPEASELDPSSSYVFRVLQAGSVGPDGGLPDLRSSAGPSRQRDARSGRQRAGLRRHFFRG